MTKNDVPLIPDAEWLEERLGQGSLWRPDEAALPAELTDAASREFLTTVGFPAVRLDAVGIDTTCLRDEDGPVVFDAAEIYGERYPDDDSPPADFALCVALWYDQHLMLDGADGGITHYDPNGWDHGAGWKGAAAHSLPRLAVLLGLITEAGTELEAEDDAERAAAVAALRVRMSACDPTVDDCGLWDEVFEDLG
ncbi:hypothetical protein SLA_6224 [Streptomyces laurentii]|uniref:SUKH-4 multi-domain protein n=1 Tax=Streptomyces laurentii TaxID=39478 RepID=A0A160P8A3_STRLU|nr:hypothetical protein SLA_6224 [Streptomyces laurentii]